MWGFQGTEVSSVNERPHIQQIFVNDEINNCKHNEPENLLRKKASYCFLLQKQLMPMSNHLSKVWGNQS